MLASGGLGVFLAAPVFMLMTLRVNRLGTTFIFTTIASILFTVLGNYLYLIPFYVVGGIILDLIFLRAPEHRQNSWWITATWTVFSGLYLLSTMIPFMGNLQKYIDDVVAARGFTQEWVDTFLKYYSNPAWVFGIFIATMIAGFLGSLIGRKLMAKHFSRAAFSMLIYLAVLGPIYVGYMAYGMRPVFLSPIQIYQAWNTFPVLAAAWIVFMTPPGMISASLARIHCPKKIILGVLVFLRFFPTFTASWRLLRDALRKRGLSRPTQMITNPLDTYEYVMVPSLLALVDSADQLSSSAVTRAAEAPHARTSYYNIPVRTKDVVCVVIAGIVCASVYYANGLVA